MVSSSVFYGADYVALGHLHGSHVLGDAVRYSGSPLAYSFSEANHHKGSWLVDLMAEGWKQEGGLEKIPGYIEDTGEVNWLVADALQLEAPVPVIAQSVMQLFASRDDRRAWARAIAVMRHGFGGHPYGPDANVAGGRTQSRVGELGPYPPKP